MNFQIPTRPLIIVLLSASIIVVAHDALVGSKNIPATSSKTKMKNTQTKSITPKQARKNAAHAQKKTESAAKKEAHKESKKKTPLAPIVPAQITIKNGVTKEAIGYQKMGMRYPDSFTLTVNGTPLFVKEGEIITDHKELPLPANQPLVIKYDYTWYAPWPWGTKKGSKSVTFKANAANKEPLSIQFTSNWKEEERIVVTGATKISKEALEE
jgi:hypothetical protein